MKILDRIAAEFGYVPSIKSDNSFGAWGILVGGENVNPVDLDKIASEGYQQNVFVKSAIDIYARTIASLPFIVTKRGANNKWKRIFDSKVEKILDRPTPYSGRTIFFFTMAADYKQFGNVFINVCESRQHTPVFLYRLRPDKISVVAGSPVTPISKFIYRDLSEWEYEEREIIFIKSYNPNEYFYGQSSIYSAGHAVDLSNQQIKWNASILKNKGIPPYYLYSDSFVDKDTAKEISDDVRRFFGGAANAGRPFVAYNGLKLQRLGSTAQEIDWREGMQDMGRYIFSCIGVPFEFVSGSGTNANLKAIERRFYIECVLPEAQNFIDHLNNQLVPRFEGEEDYKIIIDYDQILALREDIDKKHIRSRADFLSGVITRNESRDEIDYEPSEKDRIVEPLNVASVGDEINQGGGATEGRERNEQFGKPATDNA